MNIVSYIDREAQEQRAMFARVDEAVDAEQGAALIARIEWREQLGADFYATGQPISACRTQAMRRGYEMAQEVDARRWTAEPEDWAVELAAQMERNERRIEANVAILQAAR